MYQILNSLILFVLCECETLPPARRT